MKELQVRIVKFEPMQVASVRVVSETPERDAWDGMRRWAEPRGLLGKTQEHPVFGFNNPDPSQDSKEYGYEFWVRIGKDTKVEGTIQAKDFGGGLYAATTCDIKECTLEGIPQAWGMLAKWVKSSKYKFGKHQMLEGIRNPDAPESELVLGLYCPIEPKRVKGRSVPKTH